MARSSLLGIAPANPAAPGHDDLALGPSDSSDSGSDMAGLDAPDGADPQLPLDRALADDAGRALGGPDARGGSSDSAGTGERRSAAGDAGGREAADISVDRVFRPVGGNAGGDGDGDITDPADSLPADLMQAPVDDEADEDDDETAAEEDESADPVGDGHSDAELAAGLPPQPGRPNPEPDPPEGEAPGPGDATLPTPDDDTRQHQPGRDPGLRRGG